MMSTESKQEYVEATARTKTVTEAVEKTEYQCPNCEQWYDEDDLVNIGIGVNEDTEVLEKESLCKNCIRSIFGVEVPESVRGFFGYLIDKSDRMELLKAVGVVTGAILALVFTALLAVAMVGTLFEMTDFTRWGNMTETIAVVAICGASLVITTLVMFSNMDLEELDDDG